MIEPSDSEECYEFAKKAFELSEKFDTPVILRVTTRVCHSKSIVEVSERQDIPVKEYEKRTDKFTMLPVNAKVRHRVREELLKEAKAYAETSDLNQVEMKDGAIIGIVTSGISYQYAKEVFGDSVSYLKIGFTYPLADDLISDFCQRHDKIYVIEENDPYLEDAVKRLGFADRCTGKDKVPVLGELNPQIIREALTGEKPADGYEPEGVKAPGRPPVMCAGCPHRGFFHTITKKTDKLVPMGDIGCYTLGASAPFFGMDTTICMGSGLSTIIGMAKALRQQGDTRKPLGMLGDSTFFHSGINSLVDVWVSQANVIACILDNSITAMTGHQENPGSGRDIYRQPEPRIDIKNIVKAIGFPEENIRIADPLDLDAMSKAIDDGIEAKGPFVIITRRPCVLLPEVRKVSAGVHCEVDSEKCTGCKMCMKIACPSIAFSGGKADIFDKENCTACGLCEQMCKFGAIRKAGE
jgi:indolepyruvate ferredoxin oxidoreductase alpha subunit